MPKCGAEIWLSTRAIDCICKLALGVLVGRERKKKEKKNRKTKQPEQCVSKFRTQRAISLLSCLFYSKCHSISESAFGALRQRCRCTGLNIYNLGQMGWVSRELRRGGLRLLKITQQPPPENSKLLKAILTHCAVEGHCQISFRILPAIWMLLLKKALQ